MDAHLRAGIAIYNIGRHHAAHDAWEDYWLDLDSGTDDERFLHGLIQFTAAIHHATDRNWAGATGLAESAREYLDALPGTYREVNVGAVREYLAALASDPEVVERASPLELTHEGSALDLTDLDFAASAVAAPVLAEADERYDEETVERAVAYAREEFDTGAASGVDAASGADAGTSQFVALVLDFVRDPAARPIAYQRLREHAQRRENRDRDVDGLFEER